MIPLILHRNIKLYITFDDASLILVNVTWLFQEQNLTQCIKTRTWLYKQTQIPLQGT